MNLFWLLGWIAVLVLGKCANCPYCGSQDTIPIAYGKPGKELIKEADAGKIYLAGCSPKPEDCHCKLCHLNFE